MFERLPLNTQVLQKVVSAIQEVVGLFFSPKEKAILISWRDLQSLMDWLHISLVQQPGSPNPSLQMDSLVHTRRSSLRFECRQEIQMWSWHQIWSRFSLCRYLTGLQTQMQEILQDLLYKQHFRSLWIVERETLPLQVWSMAEMQATGEGLTREPGQTTLEVWWGWESRLWPTSTWEFEQAY